MEWKLWEILYLILAVLFFFQLLFCALQLYRIIHYGHKKASYQTYFLILSLCQTSMRCFFLVSYQRPWFPFELPVLFWTLTYWFPVHIEFAAFSLIVLYFAKEVHKSDWAVKRKWFIGGWIFLNLTLLVCLIAWLVPYIREPERYVHGDPNTLRAVVACVLFFILSMLLAKYGLTLSQMIAASKVQLMATNVTGCHIQALTIILIIIFVSRCVFNIIVAATHAVDFEVAGDDDTDAICSSMFLLLWELLPIFAVTFFFRHIPNPRWNMLPERGPLLGSSLSISPLATGLFQNPNRYDDFGEDLGTSYDSRVSYGSPTRFNYYRESPGSPPYASYSRSHASSLSTRMQQEPTSPLAERNAAPPSTTPSPLS